MALMKRMMVTSKVQAFDALLTAHRARWPVDFFTCTKSTASNKQRFNHVESEWIEVFTACYSLA
jgi:hypothetical protein